VKLKSGNPNQLSLELIDKTWPDQEKFPLNRDNGINVESEVFKDLFESREFLIITGFTSLSYLIDIFSQYDELSEKSLRIVLGFEPIIRARKSWPKRNFPTEIKDYWLEKGISPTKSGGVIHLIQLIEKQKVKFRCSERNHAKIYVGDTHAILGSSNFSKNGLQKQTEANIRVGKDVVESHERNQYLAIEQIANNFYNESEDYTQKIIDLLQQLLKLSEWQEALSRAIAELLEDNWLSKHPELERHFGQVELWPTQESGVRQALNIIENQGSVLIADPTGSGKTKLVASILLAITNLRWSIGKGYRTNSLIICPPGVIDNWTGEYERLRFSQSSPISSGILSYENSKKHASAISKIRNGNILIIDEAHNYLSRKSNRSHSIENSIADCIILVTATPINKKVEVLLRLIEFLDIDNLNDY
jgi:primosomal protein N'